MNNHFFLKHLKSQTSINNIQLNLAPALQTFIQMRHFYKH